MIGRLSSIAPAGIRLSIGSLVLAGLTVGAGLSVVALGAPHGLDLLTTATDGPAASDGSDEARPSSTATAPAPATTGISGAAPAGPSSTTSSGSAAATSGSAAPGPAPTTTAAATAPRAGAPAPAPEQADRTTVPAPAGPVTVGASSPAAVAADRPGAGTNWLRLLLIVTLAVAASIALRYLLRAIVGLLRQRAGHGASAGGDGPAPTPAARHPAIIDRLRHELETERDARLAVRRAYAAAESGFGNPDLARREAETPSAYLRRVLRSVPDDDRSLARLTELFVLARYSDHDITEDMRRAAIESVLALRSRYRAAPAVAA